MAVLDNEVWVLHEQELWLVNGDTGKVIATHRTPTDSNITAIAAEAGFIYAVPYGWTDGRPISVIDGQTGKTIREIETAANRNSNTYMPCGITCTQGRLFVFHDFEIISQVDAQSGEILKTIRTPYAVDPMLTHTDKHFALLGSAEIDGERCQAILLIDPTSGELVAGIPMPWESDVNCLAYHDGAFYTIDSAFRDDDGQDHPASICRWTPVNAE
jgi:hypothetical protein